MYGLRLVLILLTASLALASCSSIKIEPGGVDERSAHNEDFASTIRSDFAQEINSAEPTEQLRYLIDYAEFVGGNIINYGTTMAQQWHEGEDGRGEVISAEEMRGLIDRSIEPEKSIMRAWEDNLEYGYRIIKDSEYFRQTVMDSVQTMIDGYYDLHSTVIFPNGTLPDYEDDVDAARRAFESRIRTLRRDTGLN